MSFLDLKEGICALFEEAQAGMHAAVEGHLEHRRAARRVYEQERYQTPARRAAIAAALGRWRARRCRSLPKRIKCLTAPRPVKHRAAYWKAYRAREKTPEESARIRAAKQRRWDKWWAKQGADVRAARQARQNELARARYGAAKKGAAAGCPR